MPDAATGENIFNKADVDNSTIYITTHTNFISHQKEDSRRRMTEAFMLAARAMLQASSTSSSSAPSA